MSSFRASLAGDAQTCSSVLVCWCKMHRFLSCVTRELEDVLLSRLILGLEEEVVDTMVFMQLRNHLCMIQTSSTMLHGRFNIYVVIVIDFPSCVFWRAMPTVMGLVFVHQLIPRRSGLAIVTCSFGISSILRYAWSSPSSECRKLSLPHEPSHDTIQVTTFQLLDTSVQRVNVFHGTCHRGQRTPLSSLEQRSASRSLFRETLSSGTRETFVGSSDPSSSPAIATNVGILQAQRRCLPSSPQTTGLKNVV